MKVSMALSLSLLLCWIGPGDALFADTLKPAPKIEGRSVWLGKHSRHLRLLQTGECRVCFLGDSITESWATEGAQAWRRHLEKFAPVNCGIGKDRVEQIHYRANLLRFGESPPEVIVFLGGINNLGKPDDARTVAERIRNLAQAIRRKNPDPKILVISVLPSGLDPGSPLRKEIRELNATLARTRLASRTEFLDVHDRFLFQSGHWRSGLTSDGTHLTARGYDVLGRAIAQRLDRIFAASEDDP